MQDEVIRLFFSQGDNSCASDNATSLTLTQAAGGGTGAQFYKGITNDGKVTMAQWVTDLIAGKIEQVGP